MNSTIKKASLYTIFSFLNSGINFFILLLLAALLTPSDYGLLNLFNTFYAVLLFLISLSTTGFVSVIFFKGSVIEYKRSVSAVLFITIVVFSVLSIILFLVPSQLAASYLGFSKTIGWIALWISMTQVSVTLILDIWRIEEKIYHYGFYSFLFALLNLLLTVFCVQWLAMGWLGRLYAQFLVTFIFSGIALVIMYKKDLLKYFPDRNTIFKVLLYGIPLIPHAVSFWLRQGFDKYIVNFYYSVAMVGAYSLAMNIGSIINVIGNAYNSTNSVYLFKTFAQEYTVLNYKNYVKRNNIAFAVFGVITFAVITVGLLLIKIFFHKYLPAMPYVIPLCIGSYLQCIYVLYVNVLFYYLKTKQLMIITFLCSLIHVLMSLWLTKYSLMNTCYVFVLSNLATMLMVYVYSNNILKKYWK